MYMAFFSAIIVTLSLALYCSAILFFRQGDITTNRGNFLLIKLLQDRSVRDLYSYTQTCTIYLPSLSTVARPFFIRRSLPTLSARAMAVAYSIHTCVDGVGEGNRAKKVSSLID